MIYVHPENVNDSLLAAIWVVEENILWEAGTWRKLNWAKERREVISRLSLDLPTHLRILVMNREFGLRQIIAPCMHGRAGFASKWNSFLLWFCFIFVHHVCFFPVPKPCVVKMMHKLFCDVESIFSRFILDCIVT